MKKIIFILMCLFPVFVVFIAKDVLLEFAAKNNFISMAKFCLSLGANVNSKYYPLNVAVDNNHIQMSDLLIKKGANLNTEDKNIATPLKIAVTNDNADIAELLLKNGATAGNNSNKLLATAVKNNSTYMVDLLLENGADLNIENEQGKTPLEIAVEKDNANMVKFLLQNGAEPNIENKEGQFPLGANYLLHECSDNAVRIELLAAGAEDTICTVWGKAETYINKHQFKSAVKVIKDNSELLGKIQGKQTDKIYAAKNEYLEKEVNKYISKHQFQSARKAVKDNSGSSTLLAQIDNAQNKYIEGQINEYIDKHQFQSARQFVKQNKKNLNKDNYDYWLFEIDLQHVIFIEQVLEEVAPAAGRFYSGRYCDTNVYKLEQISAVFPRAMYKNQKYAGYIVTVYKDFLFIFGPGGVSAMSDKLSIGLVYTYKDGKVTCILFQGSYAVSIFKRMEGFRFTKNYIGSDNKPATEFVKTGLPTTGSCYR